MNSEEADRPSAVRLYVFVICANFVSLSVGTTIAWTSPMLPKLTTQSEDSPLDFKIDKYQVGWLFSIIAIGSFSSACVAGRLADTLGRKTTLMIAASLLGASYILMIYANFIELMYLARVLEGMGAGSTMTVLPMYVGEISTKEYRGSTVSLMMFFMTLGMLYVYCTGPYLPYIVFQMVCLVLPVLSFAGFLYIPESPHYLVMKGRVDDAVKALQKIRGQSAEKVMAEIPDIQEVVERARTMTKGKCKDILYHPGNRRALTIVVGLMAFQQFSGAVINVANSQTIFIQANSNLEPAVCSIIVGVIQTLSSLTLQVLVDLWKRRTLLRLSGAGMCIAQFSIGTFFYIKEVGDTSQIRWIPIVAFILFQLAYRVGFGPLPFTVMGEMFPPNIKAIAASCNTVTCWGLGFCIGKSYPLLDPYGSHYIFWTFSFFCFLSFLFAQFYVIETHGLSLNEIQNILQTIK